MTIITKEPHVIQSPVVDDKEGRRREILLRAAEIIKEHGWAKDSDGMRETGPFCLLGAVAHAMGSYTFTVDEHTVPLYSMDPPAALIGVEVFTAFVWNDHHASSGLRVRAVLQALANGATWEEATL